jgi:hypothetical protein
MVGTDRGQLCRLEGRQVSLELTDGSHLGFVRAGRSKCLNNSVTNAAKGVPERRVGDAVMPGSHRICLLSRARTNLPSGCIRPIKYTRPQTAPNDGYACALLSTPNKNDAYAVIGPLRGVVDGSCRRMRRGTR